MNGPPVLASGGNAGGGGGTRVHGAGLAAGGAAGKRRDHAGACRHLRPAVTRRAAGGVAEWFNAPVLKTDVGERPPWVRIPPPPPLAPAKAFSRSGRGRILPLYSRVMRVGLSTDPDARWPGSGLSGPIFSGPNDCADLVNSFQATGIAMFFRAQPEHFDAGGIRPRWNGDRTFSSDKNCCHKTDQTGLPPVGVGQSGPRRGLSPTVSQDREATMAGPAL